MSHIAELGLIVPKVQAEITDDREPTPAQELQEPELAVAIFDQSPYKGVTINHRHRHYSYDLTIVIRQACLLFYQGASFDTSALAERPATLTTTNGTLKATNTP